MPAPLAGRRILDLGALCGQSPHALAVAMAAKLCVDYGAHVVRLIPATGDPLANAPPRLPAGGSALDSFLNHGKYCCTAPEPCDTVIGDSAALAAHSVGAAIQIRLSVFGASEDPPVSELALAALSGLLDIVGDAKGPPTRLAGHQLPYAAGLAACTGLLAAVYAGGQDTIDVSLFDVATWLNWKAAAGMMVLGTNLKRGNARNHWGILPAQDGYVALVYQEKDWPALCEMIGDSRLAGPKFANLAGRAANRMALMDLLHPWFVARTRAVITQAAQSRRIPIGPVLWPVELLDDPQYRARGFLRPGGRPELPLVWDGQRITPEASYVA